MFFPNYRLPAKQNLPRSPVFQCRWVTQCIEGSKFNSNREHQHIIISQGNVLVKNIEQPLSSRHGSLYRISRCGSLVFSQVQFRVCRFITVFVVVQGHVGGYPQCDQYTEKGIIAGKVKSQTVCKIRDGHHCLLSGSVNILLQRYP